MNSASLFVFLFIMKYSEAFIHSTPKRHSKRGNKQILQTTSYCRTMKYDNKDMFWNTKHFYRSISVRAAPTSPHPMALSRSVALLLRNVNFKATKKKERNAVFLSILTSKNHGLGSIFRQIKTKLPP